MSEIPQTTAHTLTYAKSPGVDGLSIDRRLDLLHVEISAPRGQMRRLVIMMAVLLLAAGGFAYLWLTAEKTSEPVRVGVGIFGSIACVGGIIALGKRLTKLLERVTIEVDGLHVTYTRRFPDRIGRDQWPRAIIVGWRIVPQGWNELLQREFRLELWFSNGRSVNLHIGRAAAIKALAEAIGVALGLEGQAVRQGNPIRPSRRLTLKIFPTGYEFHIRTPRVSWFSAALLVASLAVAVVVEMFAFSDRPDRAAFVPATDWWLGILRIGLIWMVLFAMSLEGLQRIFRRKVLSLQSGQLILLEMSLTSPVRQQWPLREVAGFEAHDDGRLSVTFIGGARVDLIVDESAGDVRWIRDQVAAALTAVMPIKPPMPIELEYVPPPDTAAVIRLDGKSNPQTPAADPNAVVISITDTPEPPHPAPAPLSHSHDAQSPGT